MRQRTWKTLKILRGRSKGRRQISRVKMDAFLLRGEFGSTASITCTTARCEACFPRLNWAEDLWSGAFCRYGQVRAKSGQVMDIRSESLDRAHLVSEV